MPIVYSRGEDYEHVLRIPPSEMDTELAKRAWLPVFACRQCAQRRYVHEQAGFVVLFVGAGVGRGVRDKAINGL